METRSGQYALFLRPVDVAERLSAGKSKIYDMIATGELPSVRIGGMLRVPAAALEKLSREAMEGEAR